MQHLTIDAVISGVTGDLNARSGNFRDMDLETGDQDTRQLFQNFLASVVNGDIDVPEKKTRIILADNPAAPETLLDARLARPDAAEIPTLSLQQLETTELADDLDVAPAATTALAEPGQDNDVIATRLVPQQPANTVLTTPTLVAEPGPQAAKPESQVQAMPADDMLLQGGKELPPMGKDLPLANATAPDEAELVAGQGHEPVLSVVRRNNGNATMPLDEVGGDTRLAPANAPDKTEAAADLAHEPVLTVLRKHNTDGSVPVSESVRSSRTADIAADPAKPAIQQESRQLDAQLGQEKGQSFAGNSTLANPQSGNDFIKPELAGIQFAPVQHGQSAQAIPHRDSVASTPTPMNLYSSHNAGTPAWEDEITSQVRWLSQADMSKAEISLKPAGLGSIEIHIVTTDDKTSVNFVAANSNTRDVIENSLPRLRELLAGHGLTLTDTSVTHQDNSGGNNRGYQQVFNRPDSQLASPATTQDVKASGELVLSRHNDGQVDYYV